MDEQRFFFPIGGQQVYAVLHHPAQDTPTQGRTGVVLCHPLLDFDLYEVPWTIRMIVGYARELAQAGYPTLRFDFRGAGQSDGEFEEFTLSRGTEDIQAAIEQLVSRADVARVVLIGTRLAGTLCMRVGARDPRVDQLALWDPLPDPYGSLRSVFRRVRASLLAMGRSPDDPPSMGGLGDGSAGAWTNLRPDAERIDAGGYVIGKAFLDELKAWKTAPDVQAFRGRVLILQMILDWMGGVGLRRNLIKLADDYRAAGADCQLVEAMAVHPAEWFKQPDYAPVWRETSAWLQQAAVSAH